jgi:2-polyprenyl-3-methyl-5-hydroxy-6-metoxy-1,4-benzoquinol methylase
MRCCDALDRETLHRRLSTHRGDYWICGETGQMAREPTEEDRRSAEWYDQWWAGTPTTKEYDARVTGMQKRLASYEPYRSTGRLYEVGAGRGEFLKAARLAGWNAEGSDLSALAAEHARRVGDVTVEVGPIESLTVPEHTYDVILLNNVFEHLEQPRLVLQKMGRALRPGGVLFLQTLNAQSLSLWARPKHWMYYGPGHLYVPTLCSYDAYVTAAGLELVRRSTHGFRTGSDKSARGGWRKPIDKLGATIAGRLDLGHRLKSLLRAPT